MEKLLWGVASLPDSPQRTLPRRARLAAKVIFDGLSSTLTAPSNTLPESAGEGEGLTAERTARLLSGSAKLSKFLPAVLAVLQRRTARIRAAKDDLSPKFLSGLLVEILGVVTAEEERIPDQKLFFFEAFLLARLCFECWMAMAGGKLANRAAVNSIEVVEERERFLGLSGEADFALRWLGPPYRWWVSACVLACVPRAHFLEGVIGEDLGPTFPLDWDIVSQTALMVLQPSLSIDAWQDALSGSAAFSPGSAVLNVPADEQRADGWGKPGLGQLASLAEMLLLLPVFSGKWLDVAESLGDVSGSMQQHPCVIVTAWLSSLSPERTDFSSCRKSLTRLLHGLFRERGAGREQLVLLRLFETLGKRTVSLPPTSIGGASRVNTELTAVACESLLRSFSANGLPPATKGAQVTPFSALVQQFVASRAFESDEAVLAAVMSLCLWPQHLLPGGKIGSTEFLLAILRGLVSIKKYSVLVFVSNFATPFLLRQMTCLCCGVMSQHDVDGHKPSSAVSLRAISACAARRRGAWAVVKFLLAGHQHSPALLHEVLTWLPALKQKCSSRVSGTGAGEYVDLDDPAELSVADCAAVSDSYGKSQEDSISAETFSGSRAVEEDSVSTLDETLRDFLCFSLYQASELHAGHPAVYAPLFDLAQTLDVVYSNDELKAARVLLAATDWGSSPVSLRGSEKTSSSPFRGLSNLGNTCYLNSILQALYFCAPFRAQIIMAATEKPAEPSTFATEGINNGHHLQQQQRMPTILALQRVFTFLGHLNKPFFSPTMLATDPRMRPSWFVMGGQQDAAEYLVFLLSQLDEELPKEVLRNLFGGKIRRTVCCLECHSTSERVEELFDLTVPVPSGSTDPPVDVESLLRSVLAPEHLDGENQYLCESCDALRDAVRQAVLIESPAILTVTLGRFAYDPKTSSRTKTTTPVRVEEAMKLQVDGEPVEYELFAVVFHSGPSPNAGHYFTYATTGDGAAEWYQLNDRVVTSSSLEHVQQLCSRRQRFSSDTPYLLFYRRRGSADGDVGAWWSAGATRSQLPDWLRDELQAVNERNLVAEEKEADRLFRQAQQSQQRGNTRDPEVRTNGPAPWRRDFDDPGGFGGGGAGGGGFGGGGPSFVC